MQHPASREETLRKGSFPDDDEEGYEDPETQSPQGNPRQLAFLQD